MCEDLLSSLQIIKIAILFNFLMTARYLFEEFTEAMSQMHPDKASGPNGLNPAFYQSFWKVLGKDVFECCRD